MESNYEAVIKSDLPHQLAEEHWEFLQRWLHMVYVDAAVHFYKHGIESTEQESEHDR